MKNSYVVDIFRGIAELLEIKGDNPFRIRAYLRAADNIESLKGEVEEYASRGCLHEIPGIGADLAGKIEEIIETGHCAPYEELKKLVPEGVVRMIEIPSVGPKTAKLLYEQLAINSLEELKEAAQQGRLAGLPGIKEKTVQNILDGIELVNKSKEVSDILTASTQADEIVAVLKTCPDVEKIEIAGSLRRMKELVRDVDILAVSKKPEKVAQAFVAYPQAKKILAHGETKSSLLTRDGVQIDLRVFQAASFGAALVYFTGSKNHNIKLRQIAMKKDLKINEYGVFDQQEKCLASRTEKQVYEALGLDYIAPELREDRGEIEAAKNHALPQLLTCEDVRGDFHVHTAYSDGRGSVEDMAREAMRLGYEYVCLADHSEGLKVAGGLGTTELKKKKTEIDKVNKKLKKIKILFGTEVDIDSQGGLDYKDSILSLFDVVIAAIHGGFKQSRDQLTKRIVKACQNKYVHIIAHPTGRHWPVRESYDVDFNEILKVCRETNTSLEINAHPCRLDLSDIYVRQAKESGVRIAINSDSHDVAHMVYMKFGVAVGRRGWLEKKDVLNCLPWDTLLTTIKK